MIESQTIFSLYMWCNICNFSFRFIFCICLQSLFSFFPLLYFPFYLAWWFILTKEIEVRHKVNLLSATSHDLHKQMVFAHLLWTWCGFCLSHDLGMEHLVVSKARDHPWIDRGYDPSCHIWPPVITRSKLRSCDLNWTILNHGNWANSKNDAWSALIL